MADALKEARAVQARLNERYASEPWFRGIGIGRARGGGAFAIEVLVDEDAGPVSLPFEVDGIEVRAVRTGPIRAR